MSSLELESSARFLMMPTWPASNDFTSEVFIFFCHTLKSLALKYARKVLVVTQVFRYTLAISIHSKDVSSSHSFICETWDINVRKLCQVENRRQIQSGKWTQYFGKENYPEKHLLRHSLRHWDTHWDTEILTETLNEILTETVSYWDTNGGTYLFTKTLTETFTETLTEILTETLTYLLRHLLTYLLRHLLIHLLRHLLRHSLRHSLIYSLKHSLRH